MSMTATTFWLRCRYQEAKALYAEGKLTNKQLRKAQNDFRRKEYSSPLKLADGTILPDGQIYARRCLEET